MIKSILAVGLLAVVASPTSVEGGSNAVPDFYLPPHASRHGGEQTPLAIANHLDQDVQLMWVDAEGHAISYGVIRAGQERELSTYVRHTWLFRKLDGSALAAYDTLPDARVELSASAIGRVRQETRRRRRRGERWIPGNGRTERRESPDANFTAVLQTESIEPRRVYYVESSPDDQLQPLLRDYRYPKPGDPLPKRTVRIEPKDSQPVEVSDELFSDPYDLEFLRWSESGDRFWLLYNQRGHQVLRVLEVTPPAGEVRTVVDETSDTIIHYSDPGKNYHHFLPDGQLLWASERSGWNHLYRYDLETGEVTNAVTSGEWNVKRVVKVDEQRGRVWFYAVGIAEGQDPYHVHFCRVDLDG
ncbi:MAG: DPP IV N-terminal domain-containing protein, partial [Planctomycetales bacterium]|nr:DPP IV N-terminal domain-containing protein [Planctomycetales bacterium]